MKLNELLKNGFGKCENYSDEEKALYGNVNMNCAERILRGANEAYKLGLSEEALKLSAPFGGGMGIASVCGAITGAIMALSAMYCVGTEKNTPLKDEITIPFIKKVRFDMGGVDCKELKPKYAIKGAPHACDPTVFRIAELFDEYVEELKVKQGK